MLRASLVALSLLIGCSAPAPSASVDTGTPPEEDSAPTCTGSISDPLFEASKPSGSGSQLVFTDRYAALGYIDQAQLPTIMLHDRSDASTRQQAMSFAIDARKYGARAAALTFAHDRFALAFTTERASSDGTQTGLQAIAFATLNPETSKVSTAVYANNELDRTSGSGKGYVTARYPSVHPTADGFLVAWEDFRTKEPVVYGVNLFGWTGIYATPFTADGKSIAADGQIAQPTGMLQTSQAIASMPASRGQLVAWLARKDDGVVLHTRVGPRDGRFQPWTPDAPELDLSKSGARSLSLAHGSDGNYLAAIVAGDDHTDNMLFLQLLTADGAPAADRVKLDGERLGAVAIGAANDRYVVAIALTTAPTYPAEAALSGVRLIEVGLDGKVITDRVEPIAIEGVTLDAALTLVPLEDRVELLLSTRPIRADYYKPPKVETVSARIVTACR
jgi:hypothetical protein